MRPAPPRPLPRAARPRQAEVAFLRADLARGSALNFHWNPRARDWGGGGGRFGCCCLLFGALRRRPETDRSRHVKRISCTLAPPSALNCPAPRRPARPGRSAAPHTARPSGHVALPPPPPHRHCLLCSSPGCPGRDAHVCLHIPRPPPPITPFSNSGCHRAEEGPPGRLARQQGGYRHRPFLRLQSREVPAYAAR